jgi:hypothetical protein
MKAREFDAKDVVTDANDGSNATDDGMVAVLEDHPDDPVAQELTAFINAPVVDEQIDLVALTWLGRGDGNVASWHRGMSFGRRRAAPIMTARRATFLVCRCWRTIWKKVSCS